MIYVVIVIWSKVIWLFFVVVVVGDEEFIVIQVVWMEGYVYEFEFVVISGLM